jgi:MFS family permease
MGGIPLATNLSVLLIALAIFSVGSALFNPSMSGLVAAAAQPQERGSVLGAYQAASSLGRVIGPVLGSGIASLAGLGSPFMLGAAICLGGLLFVASDTRNSKPERMTRN